VRRRDLAAARAELCRAIELARTVERPILQRSAVATFADVLAGQGEPDAARRVLAFVSAHPATSNAERADIAGKLAKLPPGGRDPPWPGLGLDDLVERIVAEAPQAHAGLVAQLRAP